MVHVRLFQHAEELAGVGRERLHVAPLPFGEDGVERQARLAGTGETGDDHQLLAGDVQVNAAEVVFTGAADANVLFSHGWETSALAARGVCSDTTCYAEKNDL